MLAEMSAKVLKALSRACSSEDMFQTMLQLPKWPIDTINVLPREWTRKVPHPFRKFKFNHSSQSRRERHGNRRNLVG